MIWIKWSLICTVLAAVVGIAALTLMLVKDQTYVGSNSYAPVEEPNRLTAVVYYSRSGHSEAAAREIARIFNSPIARIDADYPLTVSGQRQAVRDAEAKTLPPISVEPIDLVPVRRLYLVSPTWMFRPATPLWTYVAQTDLEGKEVVLITTGNSRFEQSEIDAFGESVNARGGHLIRHVFLSRGRHYWQKSREDLLMEVRARM